MAYFPKRHIAVDTLGLLLLVMVHAASIQDSDGGAWLLSELKRKYRTLQKVWADQGYKRWLVELVRE